MHKEPRPNSPRSFGFHIPRSIGLARAQLTGTIVNGAPNQTYHGVPAHMAYKTRHRRQESLATVLHLPSYAVLLQSPTEPCPPPPQPRSRGVARTLRPRTQRTHGPLLRSPGEILRSLATSFRSSDIASYRSLAFYLLEPRLPPPN